MGHVKSTGRTRPSYPCALAVGVNHGGVFVNSFHEPVRELILQGCVKINLGIIDTI